MYRKSLFLVFAALVLALAIAVPAGAKGWHGHRHHAQKVLFVQTNQPDGNQIIVYDRHRDGTIAYRATYDTGGNGAVAEGAPSDPLASQGSLVTADHGRVLLAVNAGSDTVSVFGIRGDRLKLRQVVPSGGSFPASIAVHGRLVYVMNSAGDGTLQGYRLSRDRLYPIHGSSRSLDLSAVRPPDTPDFLTFPGQVGFSPDGSRLIVTTKVSGSLIDVWWVHRDGRLSADPVMNVSTSPVPFAFAFDRHGRLVVTEAAMGQVSTYRLNADNSLTGIGTTTPSGEIALCWIAFARGSYYGTNTGSDSISSFRVAGNGSPTLIAAAAAMTDGGPTDMAVSADQRYLYVQGGASGTIDVFRVHGNGSLMQIQTVTGLPTFTEGITAIN
jgi:6-phosphogluconolactonase (cycloisomerase 2 family)